LAIADMQKQASAMTLGNSLSPPQSSNSGEANSNMLSKGESLCPAIQSPSSRSVSYSAFWQNSEHSDRAPHRLESLVIHKNNKIQQMLTFDGCSELMRGSPLSTILRQGARVFGSSTGSASTYALSKPVERIGAFLSHNWSTPGYLKFLALSLHFNFGVAALLSLIMLAGLGTASVLGALPTMENKFHMYPVGFLCQTICIPFFICTMLGMRDIEQCFKDSSISTFLDVCCIDQTDADTKRRGIEKLGAFLKKSETVVVLFTEVYLLKLWTVYELASFLALHPAEKLAVVPVFKAKVFFWATIAMWLCFIVNVPFIKFVPFWQLRSVTSVSCIFAIVVLLRQWSRQKKVMRQRFRSFTVWNCLCANENDRPIVHENIAVLMRAMCDLPEDCSTDYALGEFNKLVHEHLSEALFTALGRLTFGYRHVALVTILVYGADAADELNALPKEGLGNLAIALDKLWRACFQLPIALAITEILASMHLHLSGVGNACWTLFISLLVTSALIGYDQLLFKLHEPPVEAVEIIILVLLNVTGVIVAIFVFGKGKWSLLGCIHKYRPVHSHSGVLADTE